MERLAHEHKPKLIIAGASAYSLRIDFERFAKVAKAVGAIFMVDMAHYAGLIAAGVYPNPLPHADVVTSTTHKSLRGPRGGIVLTNDEAIAKKINSAIFPGIQGGPLMHVIAGKAVAFKEALAPEFKVYQQQVVDNARVLAETLIERGLRIVSGRTESHVMLVDLRPKGLTGKEAEAILGDAHMTCNKNGIPNDPQKPMVTSGIRLGTPAMTTRGFKEEQARQTAHLIADVLDKPARRGQPGRRARQGRGADARLPGVPLSRRAQTRMRCPYCGHEETQVVETRESDEGDVIRRRRRCLKCDKRFTTYERPEIALPAVVKKDGARVEFDPAKLRASMTAGAAQAAGERGAGRRGAGAHPGKAARQRRARGAQRAAGRTGDARAQAHRQGGLRALCLGLPRVRGRRRVPAADPRHLSAGTTPPPGGAAGALFESRGASPRPGDAPAAPDSYSGLHATHCTEPPR